VFSPLEIFYSLPSCHFLANLTINLVEIDPKMIILGNPTPLASALSVLRDLLFPLMLLDDIEN